MAVYWELFQVALVSANVGSDSNASGVDSGGVGPRINSDGTTSKGGDYVAGDG